MKGSDVNALGIFVNEILGKFDCLELELIKVKDLEIFCDFTDREVHDDLRKIG